MLRKLPILAGTLVLVITSILSCSSPKDLEFLGMHSLTLQRLGYDHSTLIAGIEYYNPNSFGMELRQSSLDVYVNGNFLGHSSSDSLIRIPRRDSFLLPLNFDLNMQNLYRNLWSTLSGKEMTIRLSGKLKIGKAGIFMIMPVNYETRQIFSFF